MKNLMDISREAIPETVLEMAQKSLQTTKSASQEITRNGKALTRTKPSNADLNAAEIIGDIIDRFRRAAGWNLQAEETLEAKRDRQQLIAVFLEQLGAARVPVDQYERLYRRATVTRARRRAEGKENPFHLTPEEIVTEWFGLQKELADAPKETDAQACPNVNQHIDGEPVCEFVYWMTTEVILPCPVCRPRAFAQRQKEFTEKRNQSFANRRLESGSPEGEEK
jgi:hypothetical protein